MSLHLTKEELEAGFSGILNSPKDEGVLEAVVARPDHGERRDLETCLISLAGRVEGDHWAKGCWMSTEDGRPHPDVQICIMNARCIALVARERARWPLAGDNLFIDMDLSPQNLPPGQRLAIGNAVIEITAVPHNGCANFVERYGRPATMFVNSAQGKANRLRGIYARVVQDGRISVRDRVGKIGQIS
jgi:hypothetical protein